MEKIDCPNCGAPIEGKRDGNVVLVKCEQCNCTSIVFHPAKSTKERLKEELHADIDAAARIVLECVRRHMTKGTETNDTDRRVMDASLSTAVSFLVTQAVHAGRMDGKDGLIVSDLVNERMDEIANEGIDRA